ncbi:MAG: hypothetical protein KJ067_00080 [Vicinamibacteria bacterium]|nr:hypothetical protein [Vicinamibacteria bacterium]
MSDGAALRAFVEAIEVHLGRLRGREAVLSPPDFALARAWHAAGIDLARVLAELDSHAARHPTVSLSAVRRSVEAKRDEA